MPARPRAHPAIRMFHSCARCADLNQLHHNFFQSTILLLYTFRKYAEKISLRIFTNAMKQENTLNEPRNERKIH